MRCPALLCAGGSAALLFAFYFTSSVSQRPEGTKQTKLQIASEVYLLKTSKGSLRASRARWLVASRPLSSGAEAAL